MYVMMDFLMDFLVDVLGVFLMEFVIDLTIYVLLDFLEEFFVDFLMNLFLVSYLFLDGFLYGLPQDFLFDYTVVCGFPHGCVYERFA